MTLILRSGVWYEAEIKADRILNVDKIESGEKLVGAFHGILSPDQLDNRISKEVYPQRGFPDPSIHRGVFGRAHNPLFGKRPHRGSKPQEEQGYDSRVGGLGSQLGWEMYSPRDYAGALCPPNGAQWRLDRYQRCRVRKVMRALPERRVDARLVVREILAEKYGVPPWVIYRACL